MTEADLARRLLKVETAIWGDDGRGGINALLAKLDTTLDEQQRHRDRRDEEDKQAIALRESRQLKWWTVIGTVIASMMLMLAWLTYREGQRHADNSPIVGQNQTTPQHATASYTLR